MTLGATGYEQVEVIGDAIIPVLRAIQGEALSRSLLNKVGLKDVQKGKYYPISKYLKLLHDIESRMPTIQKKIGEFICAEAVFPESMDFPQLLMSSEVAYQMNHRGHSDGQIGHYECEKKSSQEYLMKVSNPYPCIFTQGIFSGYAKRFKVRMTIEHADELCRTKGDSHCNYQIKLAR